MSSGIVLRLEEVVQNAIKAGKDVHSIKDELGSLFDEKLFDQAIVNVKARLDRIYDLVDPYVIARDKVRSEKFRWYGGPTALSVRWEFAQQKLFDEGRSAEELEEVVKSSSQILGLLSSPSIDTFASRGLVLGYVQSGKTTNFIATIAQAADEGYRLIIVLSGVTNNLRRQTQDRLVRSLTGENPINWHWLTSVDSDFNESKNAGDLLSAPGNRVIAVIKKNNSRLKRLHKWLESAPIAVRQGLPVLIIDDEADQATVNSHKQLNRQTAINKTLTSILKSDFLPKNAYLGYTATPFANILSDAKDANQLYPRDFIYPMKRSNKYFGAEQLFGRDPIDENDQEVEAGRNIIIPIPDDDRSIMGDLIDPKHGFTPVNLPQSLTDAISWFLVATAARKVRTGKNKFSTMLIHTSGRIPSHNAMKKMVVAYVEELQRLSKLQIVGILENCWIENASNGWVEGDSPILSWEDIEDEALFALEAVKIIVDNSQSDDRLFYDFENEEETTPFIVIGGNTLARGLTLEGLNCSYFMRTSSAYDSLLQMGRWFGYRVGYEDLQRIWMQDDLITNFRDMALVEEEIRQQIEFLAAEGLDPSQVPIRIRDHKFLTITAMNKMNYAKRLQIGYSDTRVETITFEYRKKVLVSNQNATRRFIESIKHQGFDLQLKNAEGWPMFKDIPWVNIKEFFANYSWAPSARIANGELLSNYIDAHQGHGDLEKWNVFIYQIDKCALPNFDLGNGILATPITRSALDISEANKTVNVHHLVSSIDGAADTGLTKQQVTAKLKSSGLKVSDSSLRNLREEMPDSKSRGLLGIYVIDPQSKAPTNRKTNRKDLNLDDYPIGLGVFFGTSHVISAGIDYFGPDLIDAFEIEEDDYLDAADEIDDAGAA